MTFHTSPLMCVPLCNKNFTAFSVDARHFDFNSFALGQSGRLYNMLFLLRALHPRRQKWFEDWFGPPYTGNMETYSFSLFFFFFFFVSWGGPGRVNKIGNSVRITSGFQEYVCMYAYVGHLPPHNVTQPLKTDTLAPKNLSVRVVVFMWTRRHAFRWVFLAMTSVTVSSAGRCAYSMKGRAYVYATDNPFYKSRT